MLGIHTHSMVEAFISFLGHLFLLCNPGYPQTQNSLALATSDGIIRILGHAQWSCIFLLVVEYF